MAGNQPEETRVFARLPGLDVAVVHRGAQGEAGEQMMVALRAVPSTVPPWPLLVAATPLLFWAQMAQATWATWLTCLAVATTPPGVTRDG
jgi:hypothetical protein